MFLPIRDHNPSERRPVVTYGLIVLNLMIFASYWWQIDTGFAMARLFSDWALVPADVADGRGFSSLVTYMFLHGGFLHIAGNMLFLWIFGDNLEDELGHIGFLIFYLAAGVGAALLQVAAAPNSPVPVVGASGAIAGVMGGYLLLFPRAKIDILFIIIIFFRVFSLPAWIVLGAWFGIQLFATLNPGADQGVAWMAHIGGFLAGFGMMSVLWLQRGGTAFWRRTQGHPPHPEARYGPLTRTGIPSVDRRNK